MIRRWAFLLPVVLLACKPPPQDQMQAEFVKNLNLYFNALNSEGQSRKDLLRAQTEEHRQNPALSPPTGTQYNSFHFNERGVVAYNVRCKRSSCRQNYLVVDYYGRARECARCGQVLISKTETGTAADWLTKNSGGEVKPMFEPTQKDTAKMPLKAVVRYVRRNWAYDPRGSLDIDLTRIPDKNTLKAEIKTAYLPGFQEAEGRVRVPAGFHRPDTVFVVEQEFEFDGSSVKPIGPAREEPLRPWTDVWDIRAGLESSR